MTVRSTIAALACAAALSGSASALAQTAAPTAAPAPAPVPVTASPSAPFKAFSGRGTMAMEAMVSDAPVKLGMEVAVMYGGHKVRIDLVHLDMSGNSPSTGSMMAQLLPQGTMTLVFDQTSGMATIWSEQKHAYYQTKVRNLRRSSKPSPQKSTEPQSSVIDQILGATKSMTEYDVFSQSVALVGHQVVNGHMSSLFHYTMQTQKRADKLQDASGDIALADDLSGIPIRLWTTVKGKYDGSLKLDLTSASLSAPMASVFTVPHGYKKVAGIMDLLGHTP
ncbi:MAG: hypothetical protein M3N19_10215 [Candidatus Eremiobacteraeota bacterium]|nr:hypothetical protein [Candidatus Eremiobacteraeota bacterium]